MIEENLKLKLDQAHLSMTLYVDSKIYYEATKINESLKVETGRTL